MANPLTTTTRALLAAAWRPLEWQFGGDESRNGPHMPWAVVMPTDEGEWVVLEMNTHRIGYSFSARLIAAAPTLLEQLCKRVEELEGELATAKADVQRWMDRDWNSGLEQSALAMDLDTARTAIADFLAAHDAIDSNDWGGHNASCYRDAVAALRKAVG